MGNYHSSQKKPTQFGLDYLFTVKHKVVTGRHTIFVGL